MYSSRNKCLETFLYSYGFSCICSIFAALFSEMFSSNSEHILRTPGTAEAHATTVHTITYRRVKNEACSNPGTIVSKDFPQILKHYGLSPAESEVGQF